MTRYSLEKYDTTLDSNSDMVENSDGAWVRYEDVEELLEELRTLHDEAAGASL